MAFARSAVPQRVVAAAMLMLGLLAGAPAFAQPAPQAPRHGGILEFAVGVEPKNYDCYVNTSFAFLHPVAPHYSTLLKFDAANYPRIVGDLAQSWSVAPDRMTYTFKLRPDVLFHDGSLLSSADIKASYERLIDPPPGVAPARRVDYTAISSIDTPDALTVVFRLRWPDAAMLANFASPWNCIYSAARLAQDPQFPKTHILGTGAFVFAEHVNGQYWRGKRFERYFQPGKPYLDGFQADFITGAAVMAAYKSGKIAADFRGVSPPQRDELVAALGDKVTVSQSPWLANLSIVFNTRRPPFDDVRVRRALSLAIDRWGAAQQLQKTTFLKYVGGLMRPGSSWATPEAELVTLPGFGHDIAASRAEARQLLAAAGVHDLKLTLLVRDIPMPHYAGADLLVDSWRQIGVAATEKKLGIFDWQKQAEAGDFDVALDFSGDFYDDPTIQLTKYVSPDLSPGNYSGATDRFLDGLYIGQAVTSDPQQRARIVRAFERHALNEADTVPLLWWNRIVVTSAKLHGWYITPSHFIGQDLTDVWLDR
ncbi:MAG TPA: ABC transporter substrate-binding protein [Stellaceae bacterium]|jgi:peptide/nickel transport system substrate-binding protein|nr:ABC transporter substrate-binding protein [Stellaceae bacterium]